MPRFEDAAWALLETLLTELSAAPLVGGLVARRPRGASGGYDGLVWSPAPPVRAPLPSLDAHLPSMRVWEILTVLGEPVVVDFTSWTWIAPRSGISRSLALPSRSLLLTTRRASHALAAPLGPGMEGMVVLELSGPASDWGALCDRVEASLANHGDVLRFKPGTAPPARRVLDFPVRPSPRMASTLRVLERFAATDEVLLLTGAPGVGKTSLAAACHRASPRAEAPFRGVRLSAIPESQRLAKLFGWGPEPGGLVGAARGGTLLLDDMEHAGLPEQQALLELIDTGQARPAGEGEDYPVDLRLIVASGVDLRERVKAGAFLPELLARLEVLPVYLPPMGERREEIVDWAKLFLDREDSALGLGDDGAAWLTRQSWPGNLRELVSVIKRATLLCVGPRLTESALREAAALARASEPEEALRQAVRRLIALAGTDPREEDLYDISDKLLTALLVDEWSRFPPGAQASPLRRQREAGNLSRSLDRAENSVALLRRWLSGR